MMKVTDVWLDILANLSGIIIRYREAIHKGGKFARTSRNKMCIIIQLQMKMKTEWNTACVI